MSHAYGGSALGAMPAGCGSGLGAVTAGSGTQSKAGGVVSGAVAGAAYGTTISPGYGTVIGAVVGAAGGYAASNAAAGGATQGHGRFSVEGHRAIMTALIHAKRWDDADAETQAWFANGQGTADERRRFQPNGPRHLHGGAKNYSLVADYGHQEASVQAVTVSTPDGGTFQFGGASPIGGAAQAGFFGGGGDASTTYVVVGLGLALLFSLSKRKARHAGA